jgi:hypothetical protein
MVIYDNELQRMLLFFCGKMLFFVVVLPCVWFEG